MNQSQSHVVCSSWRRDYFFIFVIFSLPVSVHWDGSMSEAPWDRRNERNWSYAEGFEVEQRSMHASIMHDFFVGHILWQSPYPPFPRFKSGFTGRCLWIMSCQWITLAEKHTPMVSASRRSSSLSGHGPVITWYTLAGGKLEIHYQIALSNNRPPKFK